MQAISPASGADPASEAAPAAAPSARMGDARHASYPGLAAALIGHAAAEAAAGARAAMQRGALWRFSLRGPLPGGLAVAPDALAPATLEGAQDILRGRFALGGGVVELRGQSPFDAAMPTALRAELHRFAWLAHLEKAGGKTAHFVARALVEDWIDRYRHVETATWAPEVLGPRLVQWAAHFRFLIADHDLIFRSRLLKTMAEQTRHLARTIAAAPPGPGALAAAAALVIMDCALPEGERRSLKAAEALRLALEGAVLPDGGIVTRSPDDQAEGLAGLLRAGRALADAHRAMPPFLPDAAARMRAQLALMRHGDGRLGCFNGSSEGDAQWLADLLEGEPAEAAAAFAPDWGYARLAAGPSCVLFDAGGPPPGGHASAAHAAPAAFELSREATRIVVNGGVARRRGADWVAAARRTAAHACLQIGEADAGEILAGSAAARLGPRLYGGTARGEMQAGPDGQWAEATHDFYARRFGATHRRRLFLDATGHDLRGEDTLVRSSGRGRLEVAIRFPLHPDCRATIAQSGDSVLIAPHEGDAWRFRAGLTGADSRLSIEPSIYMGGETVRRAEAIVIRAAALPPEWTMRWAFAVETPGKRTRRRIV